MSGIKHILKALFEDPERVTVYPTYGYRDGDGWKVPLRIWVHEPRPLAEALVKRLAESIGAVTEHERENLTVRMADIVADSESLEKVVFAFDNDPDGEDWRVRAGDGGYPKSDLNGIVKGFIELDDRRAARLLAAQNSHNGWLTFRATSKDHSGIGRARLIEPRGLSLISDIDDTIKITEIPAGGKVVVRNTFLYDFRAVPQMAGRYRNLGKAAFHYVSGGPWQLFRPLAGFLKEQAFPEGSFHMKSVPKNLLSPTTWKSLINLIGDATIAQKIAQIGDILGHFPERKFICVGDSGEHDPEVYDHIRDKFGAQVKEIWIRDVVNERHAHPDRFKGMTLINP
jgi:hypothetical protein